MKVPHQYDIILPFVAFILYSYFLGVIIKFILEQMWIKFVFLLVDTQGNLPWHQHIQSYPVRKFFRTVIVSKVLKIWWFIKMESFRSVYCPEKDKRLCTYTFHVLTNSLYKFLVKFPCYLYFPEDCLEDCLECRFWFFEWWFTKSS